MRNWKNIFFIFFYLHHVILLTLKLDNRVDLSYTLTCWSSIIFSIVAMTVGTSAAAFCLINMIRYKDTWWSISNLGMFFLLLNTGAIVFLASLPVFEQDQSITISLFSAIGTVFAQGVIVFHKHYQKELILFICWDRFVEVKKESFFLRKANSECLQN